MKRKKNHDVRVDRDGSRLTCYEPCDCKTLVRQRAMRLERWRGLVETFLVDHPCRLFLDERFGNMPANRASTYFEGGASHRSGLSQ